MHPNEIDVRTSLVYIHILRFWATTPQHREALDIQRERQLNNLTGVYTFRYQL